MLKLLVSECLTGSPCRYDGKSIPCQTPAFQILSREVFMIPFCPEVAGGLPTPRAPAEIKGAESVFTRQGDDVTEAFRTGARKACEKALAYGISFALLKEKSPSCGVRRIYDGTFTGRLIDGAGITTDALLQAGIPVFSEKELEEGSRFLGEE